MGLHYLINYFDQPIEHSRIADVIVAIDGTSEINGHFVVRVPFDVPVKNPSDLEDLITKKYEGFMLQYVGFTRVAYDDLLNVDHINIAHPDVRGVFGQRCVIGIEPGAKFVSTTIALVPPEPARAIMTWDAFDYPDTDPYDSKHMRIYRELDPDLVMTCEISFDNGAHYRPIKNRRAMDIIFGERGTNFIVQITNTTANRVYMGSWAVIY